MSEMVKLSTVKANLDNRVCTKDEDGYYKVTFGAFNVRNSAGDVYSSEGVKELLTTSKSLAYRRLTMGRLRSEADHPAREPGISDHEWIIRNLDTSMKCVCGHIKEISIVETEKSEGIPGIGNIMYVVGWIKPSGKYGDGLKESLDNPNEDTCFSIRSFTKDTKVSHYYIKKVLEVVTWDWINAPGIKYASKLSGPALETINECSFDIDELLDAAKLLPASNENADIIQTIDSLRTNVNNEVVDIINRW